MIGARWPLTMRLMAGLAVTVAGSGAVACAHPAIRADVAPPAREFSATIRLNGRPLELHLAEPAAARRHDETAKGAPLVLYASGDGGWFGAAIDMFHAISADGYPTVGISSKALMKLAEPHHVPLRPDALAADYLAILAHARTDLALPDDTPAILAGWSRGAAFAVIVAAQSAARPVVRGVVAIGMTRGEALRIDDDDDGTDDGPDRGPDDDLAVPALRRGEFDIYAVLRGLRSVRSAVVQATHDNYLPAAQARRLFGLDTATRRLFSVEARNHRFSGGRDAFHEALDAALRWTSTAAD